MRGYGGITHAHIHAQSLHACTDGQQLLVSGHPGSDRVDGFPHTPNSRHSAHVDLSARYRSPPLSSWRRGRGCKLPRFEEFAVLGEHGNPENEVIGRWHADATSFITSSA